MSEEGEKPPVDEGAAKSADAGAVVTPLYPEKPTTETGAGAGAGAEARAAAGSGAVAVARTGGGTGKRRARKWWLLAVLAAALGAGVWVFISLSEDNASTYFLVAKEDRIEVRKGRYFPWGTSLYEPAGDAKKAFAPIVVPKGVVSVTERTFRSAGELTVELFDVLRDLAKGEAYAAGAKDFARARGYLDRGLQLPDIAADRVREMNEIRGDVLYLEGKLLIDGAEAGLKEAQKKFEAAKRQGTTSRSRDVDYWMVFCERKVDAFHRTEAPRAVGADGVDAGALARPLVVTVLVVADAGVATDAGAGAVADAGSGADAGAGAIAVADAGAANVKTSTSTGTSTATRSTDAGAIAGAVADAGAAKTSKLVGAEPDDGDVVPKPPKRSTPPAKKVRKKKDSGNPVLL
ncbi:MAG: hypothetical protein HYY84_18285 [Deltaproteobacteria bacterium]|nr:hypothetical protein [Deltaproteobacteria bacterium]